MRSVRSSRIPGTMEEFICNCGKVFSSRRSLNSHARFCKQYVKIDKSSKYKVNDNKYVCECGKEFEKFQSLNAHFSHCDIHHNMNNTQRKGHTSEISHSMCWNKTNEEINEIHKRAGKTYSDKIKAGKLNPSWLGRNHSEESKEKIRISTLKYLEDSVNDFKPRYSKHACEFIDKLNKEKNWNLQHAENGGEINLFGYFPDGYDKDLNIIFEYDEGFHYKNKYENILNDFDIERQNYLINKLNCKFIRYNEYLNLLYEVN